MANAVKSALIQAKQASEKDRRDTAQKLLDYYRGYFTGHEVKNYASNAYLDNLIRERFPNNYEQMKPHISVLNIIRPLTDERSMVFKNGVDFKVVDDETGKKTEKLYEILPKNYDHILKTADSLKTLLKTILIRVNFRDGQIFWEIITPNVFNVIQNADDPTEADAYIIMQRFVNTENEATIYFKVWTKEEFWIEDENGAYVKPPEPNPYGELPFAVIRDELAIDEFFPEMDEGLIIAQDVVNLTKTMIEYIKAYHSFPTVVVKNWSGGEKIPVGAGKVVVLKSLQGQEASYEVIPSPMNLTELRNELNEHIKEVFKSYGMTPPRETKQPSSGIAIKLENYKLIERREDQIEIWRSYLYELLRLTIKVWNTHQPIAKRVNFTADDIVIDFGEIHFPMSRAEQLDTYKKELELGITSPSKILQRENPDLSEEDALVEAEQNLKETQMMKSNYMLSDILSNAPGVEE